MLTGDQLGISLAVSATSVIAGAPGRSDNTGAVYIFDTTRITDQPTLITAPDGKAEDKFGGSVAVCDGTSILVGASGYDENQGGAYLYSGVGDAPVVIQYEPYSPVEDFEFGYAVACRSGKAVIGARNKGDDKEGDAFLYQKYGANGDMCLQPCNHNSDCMYDKLCSMCSGRECVSKP